MTCLTLEAVATWVNIPFITLVLGILYLRSHVNFLCLLISISASSYRILQYKTTLTKIKGIKNDFSGHLHRFMASLTDARHKMHGKTVLYIPNENNNYTGEQAAKSKDYVQRLEGQWIH